MQEEVNLKLQLENSKKTDDKPEVHSEQQPFFCVNPSPPTPPLAQMAQPLLETTTLVTPPRPLDPSPAGGEMKKQFVLLVPNAMPEQLPPILSTPENFMFSVNIVNVPPEKRLALRIKLKELVDAVVYKNLNPERIIIAYNRS